MNAPTALVVSVTAFPAWSTTALIFRPRSDLQMTAQKRLLTSAECMSAAAA